ncbi:ATP-binding protein [Salidesulfovibrio brasiliensis]|uniref:ATP-binding protein n=1 Tax=Salidesulfovibrio brasiliensis TaxID=221711 RepID=UPI0006D22923|nr:ATP-binding protein [Salidesulfovibrio brasiliensis]
MRIAVASGKGGTGKTTVATNLALHYMRSGRSVAFVDCDVEEPNAHLFLKPETQSEETAYVPVPEIDEDACIGSDCRECVRLCRYKALIWMAGSIMPFTEMCHSCGLCMLACPARCISEGKREIGKALHATTDSLSFHHGLMRIGEAMAPPLIREVKNRAAKDMDAADVSILDCPPGASCPVVQSLENVDFAVLVTEPTPFGLHDLNIAVQLLRKLDIPFGAVINREGMGPDARPFLKENDIDLLGVIPHSIEAAGAYSRGEMLYDALPDVQQAFVELAERIQERTGGAA